VAHGAIGGKRAGNMIGHRASERCGALPGCDVASVTRGGAERVIVADVARNARRRRRRNMHSGQSKSRGAVVESRGGPAHGRMARRTVPYRK